MQLKAFWRKQKTLICFLGAPCAGALFLLLIRMLVAENTDYWFMAWNLLLSLLGLAAAALFARYWHKKSRLVIGALLVVWLLLLPNTFYILTDFIHVGETNDINILFDIVMLMLFTFAGFMQGCIAIYLVHKPLIKRYGRFYAHLFVLCIILASSFAITMGRYLRWNSWDALLHPQTLLFDVSDTFLNPANYNRSFVVTGVFFVAICSAYATFYTGRSYLRRKN